MFILNLNDFVFLPTLLDESVTVEMPRLRAESAVELIYTPLYKTD